MSSSLQNINKTYSFIISTEAANINQVIESLSIHLNIECIAEEVDVNTWKLEFIDIKYSEESIKFYIAGILDCIVDMFNMIKKVRIF